MPPPALSVIRAAICLWFFTVTANPPVLFSVTLPGSKPKLVANPRSIMLPTTPTIRRRPATPAEAAAIVAKAERLNATPSLEAVDLYLPAEYVAEFHKRAKVIHQIQGGQAVVLAASAVVSQLQNDAALGLLTIEEPATV